MNKVASYKAEIYKQAKTKKENREPLIPKEQLIEYIVPAITTPIGMRIGGTIASNISKGNVVATAAGLGTGAILGYGIPERILRNKRLAKEKLKSMSDEIEMLKKNIQTNETSKQ